MCGASAKHLEIDPRFNKNQHKAPTIENDVDGSDSDESIRRIKQNQPKQSQSIDLNALSDR